MKSRPLEQELRRRNRISKRTAQIISILDKLPRLLGIINENLICDSQDSQTLHRVWMSLESMKDDIGTIREKNMNLQTQSK